MKRLRRTFAILLLIFLLAPSLFLIYPFSGPAGAQTPPPANGDWIITDTTTWSDDVISMTGNITVKSGGRLTLQNVSIRFNSTIGREYRLTAEKGSNLTVDHCDFDALNQGYGYNLVLWDTSSVTNSTFRNGGRYLDPKTIIILSGQVFFSNNLLIEAHNNTGIVVGQGAAPRIFNNTILGGFTGIFIYDNTQGHDPYTPILFNNTIINSTDNGIFLGENTRPLVHFNHILNPGNRGIQIQFDEAIVGWNDITGSKNEAGIFLLGATSNPTVWIHNNTITDCVVGLTTSGTASGLFENNTIERADDIGILSKVNSKLNIERNVIRDSPVGIEVRDNANPMIAENDIINNDYGIKLESRAKSTIRENLIRGGRYGIWSRQSSPEIEANDIKWQLDTGIQIKGRHTVRIPTVIDNDLSYMNIGIDICESDPDVLYNDISFTNLSSILLGVDATPRIMMNNITKSLQKGILVEPGSEPIIRENLLSSNFYGLVLMSSTIDINDNTFVYNDFAISCENGADSVFFNNTFIDSTFFDFVLKWASHPTVQSSPFNISHVAADVTSSLSVEWTVDLEVVNSKGIPLEEAAVTFYDNEGVTAHYDKTEADGILPHFIIPEAIVTYDGIREYGPYDVTVQWNNEANTTIMDIVHDIDEVLYVNFMPILDISEMTVIEDLEETFDLSPYLFDEDGDPSNLEVQTDSSNIIVDEVTQVLTLFYQEEVNYEIVTFNISDGISTTSDNVIVKVVPVNDRPTFMGPILDFNVFEDVGWSLNLSEFFNDEEHPEGLLFTASSSEIIIDNTTKKAIWEATSEHESLLDVTIRAWDVADGYYVDSNPFKLELIPVNDPPAYIGGLKNKTVKEDEVWSVDLGTYFDDEENPNGLTYSSSDPRVHISGSIASWTPQGGDVSIVGLTFTAYDVEDHELMATSSPISLIFEPVDDPPEYRKGCMEGVPEIIYSGQTWQVVLSDCFSDEERDILRYDSNYRTKITIVNDSLGRVKAIWAPEDKGTDIQITKLIFYAYQVEGESKGRRAQSEEINITFKANQTTVPPKPQVQYIYEKIPWYVYASIPVAIIGTAVSFYVYRRLKFHKYEIKDIFLVFNDGRLITHMTGYGEVSDIDEDILASMLTAIQDFVKESLASREVSSLDEMKYGDMKILIERGIFAYLSVVISGHVTGKLKDEMKETLRNIERKYATILEGWDGDNKRLQDIEKELNVMIEHQPKNVLDLLKSY